MTVRTTRWTGALAVLAGLVFAQAAAASAPATMGMDVSKARNVGADFISTSGCAQTEVDLFANDVLSDTGGFRLEQGTPLDIAHFTGPHAFMHVQRWDCDGNLVLDGFGPPCCDQPPLAGLTISRDLTSAGLETTIPIYDSISDSTQDYTLNLSWTAIPPLTRAHTVAPRDSHCINHNGGHVENLIFNDVGRGYGASVAGSVSDVTNVYSPDTVLNAFISEDTAKFLHIGFSDGPCLS
jgi:hypothetical protein